MALVFRHRIRIDPLISKWFRILDEADLVPDQYRASGVRSYRQVSQGALEGWNEAWRSDEFVLDPTRITLFIGKTGMNGYDFREKILMDRFGIQINKTSINSVLLIITIGVTWSSIHYLLDALRRVAGDFERNLRTASQASRALQKRRVEEITTDLPPLPDFSEFDAAFRPDGTSPFGDMRSAFYAGYEDSDREYVLLGEAARRIAEGKTLVSTTFVVPYPPGFPVLVPGQMISKEILYFLAQLDVKEIHGYNPDLGLSVFIEAAIARLTSTHGKADAHASARRTPGQPGVLPAVTDLNEIANRGGTFATLETVAWQRLRCSAAGTKVSFTDRGDTHRSRFSTDPALSFAPLARAPPKGCCPTTAPVGLSLT